MKKLLFVLVMFLFVNAVKAEENPGAYFNFCGFEFTYPLAHTNAISLYDFTNGAGLLGAETKLVSGYNFTLFFGAVTSFNANGMPFISVGYDFAKILNTVPETIADAGLWIGYDFKINENRAGIKASVKLW